MLKLDTLTREELLGAGIAELVAGIVARQPDEFNERLSSCDPSHARALLETFERTFGWTPPDEFQTWLAIEEALGVEEGNEGFWGSGDRSLFLDFFNSDTPQASDALRTGSYLPHNAEELLTGLFKLSEDAAGDRVLASLLPDELGLLSVHKVTHGRGALDKPQSLKTFLLTTWVSDERPDSEQAPGAVGIARYEELMALADSVDSILETQRQRPAQTTPDSKSLYHRAQWLIRMTWGHSNPLLAQHLAQAPTMADWASEQAVLLSMPVLTNYWMLAHYFLGNSTACTQAIAAGRQSPGLLTRRLAEQIDALLTAPEVTHLGDLSPARLSELRHLAREAASPAQLSS
ncbi:hypothetical protein KRR26_19855 [Corallococcus sp. M34]|uniref:hypothetical protein n=1 Tax=Citreicoccus inhibens TaxID=2849499 RepID=UPI001C236C4D|nr:hypothetical protein [Citreicoccus inhibens]MBU8897875.1 hypothetical protein [Citreicoccus inhibens]